MPTTREQWATFWIAVVVSVAMIAMDVALHHHGKAATFSQVFGKLSDLYGSLLLTFVFWVGVLVGHILRFKR